MTQLASLLKYYRENCDLSQQQIAQALNIDRSTYTYYETGKTIPSAKTLIKIARILNVPFKEFFDCVEEEMYGKNDVATVSDITEKGVAYPHKVELRNKIYELSDDEKELVLRFRSLTIKGQNDFLNSVFNYEQKDLPKTEDFQKLFKKHTIKIDQD